MSEQSIPGGEIHLQEEELALYVDALLGGTEARLPAGILDHVEDCPLCQGMILDVHEYLHQSLALPEPSPARIPFSRKRRAAPAWLLPAGRLAAGFTAVVLLASVFFLARRDPSPLSPAAAAEKAATGRDRSAAGAGKTDAPPPLPPDARRGDATPEGRPAVPGADAHEGADAFAINSNLEFMIDSRSRSFIVDVHSPTNHSTQGQEILFSWREFGGEPLSLVIVNNRNEAVFASPVRDGRLLFSRRLAPGCYYWKLESASELFYVGKFFVAAGAMSPAE